MTARRELSWLDMAFMEDFCLGCPYTARANGFFEANRETVRYAESKWRLRSGFSWSLVQFRYFTMYAIEDGVRT
jgi:hypothetical protein